MILCALISIFSAIKVNRPLAYIAIGMMAIIVGAAAFIPLGVGMHYHPDTNYTIPVLIMYAPIIIVAVGLTFLVHRFYTKQRL